MNNLARNRKKPRVTIIVGIISQASQNHDPDYNCIVIASDSQTTWGTLQRSDTDKMSQVVFSDGTKALVAQSGDSTLGSRAIEIFGLEVGSAVCDDYRKPAEMAEQAVAKAKRECIRLNDLQGAAAQQFIRDYNFSLMIAYYYGQPPRPYLYVIDSPLGVASQQRDYAAIGCGATVAELILSRSDVPSLFAHEATITAIYAVEEVKRVDPFCGGPTKLAVIFQGGVFAFSKTQKWADRVQITVDTIRAYDQEAKATWKQFMMRMTQEAEDKFKEKYPVGGA